MKYTVKKLANGLRVLTVPMASSESATITVWVKTGSRNENKKVGGISHFLEHMVFKGSSKRPTAKEISETVDSIGGEFNAGTSKDWTNYYIKARSQNLELAMDVLSDMVLSPILDKDEIEREKGTIVQEIAMYEDAPMMKIGNVYEELIFEGNVLADDTIGTSKTVRSIKRDDFVRYRDIHYYPENMLVTVAGGISQNEVLKLAEKFFGSFTPSTKSTFKDTVFKGGQVKPRVLIKNKKSDQAHFILGFMGDPRGYKNRHAQAVLSSILGGGMSSRLFTEVRERRGLAYAVKTGIERYQDIGYVSTYIGTDPMKVEEAISVTLSEYYALRDKTKPVTDVELKKAKEYIKGHLALALEETSDVGGFFGEQELFLGEVMTPEEVFKAIDKVTTNDVYKEAARLFKKESLNLAIIGPFKDKEKFTKLLK